MTGGDPIRELQAFIDERWAVAQPRFYPQVAEGPRVQPEVTRSEAEFFLASVAANGHEPPLFEVDDDRKMRSDRFPPKRDGSPRGYPFFEEPGRLRLETIVHMAAAARLREELGWPREHLVFESPDVVDDDGEQALRYDALDILLLEAPCAQLSSRMSITATRSRVAVETKADRKLLDRCFKRCAPAKHEATRSTTSAARSRSFERDSSSAWLPAKPGASSAWLSATAEPSWGMSYLTSSASTSRSNGAFRPREPSMAQPRSDASSA